MMSCAVSSRVEKIRVRKKIPLLSGSQRQKILRAEKAEGLGVLEAISAAISASSVLFGNSDAHQTDSIITLHHAPCHIKDRNRLAERIIACLYVVLAAEKHQYDL